MQTHFQAEATDIDGFRTTAVSYATSALLHQTHMHAELEKKRHTLSVTLRVRVLDHDVPASGPQARCFDMLHLPHSATQRSSFAHLVAAWVFLWSSETKPKNLAICFMCSRLKPPTRQQQQKQQTTGGYSHICYSDLGHYHFIVWHTICIKQQFSVPKRLAWLKTVSDVQRGMFVALKGLWPRHYKWRPVLLLMQVYHCHPGFYLSSPQAHTGGSCASLPNLKKFSEIWWKRFGAKEDFVKQFKTEFIQSLNWIIKIYKLL